MKLRESGVPELGKIPAHWEVARLKFCLRGITQGWSPPCEVLPAGPDDWGVLKAGCVNGHAFNAAENKRLPDRETPRPEIEVHPRDVIMSRANTTELVGSAAIVPPDVRPRLLLSDKLYRLEVMAGELMPEFLVYSLRTASARSAFESTASGASNSMQNISQEVVRNLWLPMPPIDEQRAIVARLVNETAHLDTLLAAKQRLLDLLAEKRKVIIATAVTRGLDPKVMLRDSGVPWLGALPTHWRINRLRHLSDRISGRLVFKPAQYFVNTGVPFLMGNNISEDGLVWDNVKYISEGTNASFAHHALRTDDVVTVRVGAPGVTCVVPPEADGLNCGSMMIIRRSPRFVSTWLALLMNSHVVRTQVALVQYGAAQEQINIGDALDFVLPVPPLDEQRSIVEHIARETARIDAVRAATEWTIALLKERRSALIAAAVTGQLDVSAT